MTRFVQPEKIEIDANERAVNEKSQYCFFVCTTFDSFLNDLSISLYSKPMNNSTTESEVSTMYYTQEQIDRANQADLVSFLQSQGEQLTRAGNEYRWKRHDSLTVRGNKWYRHSQSKGGAPVDFVMEFFGKSFTEAVEMLTGEKGAALPPDRPSPAPLSDFRLPPRNTDNRTARNYLTAARRIDEDVTGFFLSNGDIYEEAAHHNAVDRKSTRLNSSHSV